MTRFIKTRIPRGSFAVRWMNKDGNTYRKAVVVTPKWFGRHLFLQLWIGELPGVWEWRDGAAEHFPRARTATILRKVGDTYEERFFRLQPPDIWERLAAAITAAARAYWKLAAAELRKFYGFRNR